jgi:hypothetical protein
MVEQIAAMVAIAGVAAVLIACMLTQIGLNAVVVEQRIVPVEKEHLAPLPASSFSDGE